jgi:hypothetical protein
VLCFFELLSMTSFLSGHNLDAVNFSPTSLRDQVVDHLLLDE